MFCIKCGNRLGENMKFCDQCGAPVPVEPDKLEAKKEKLEEFKPPIIDEDPMDLVPEEFEEKPSESEKVKEEIAEEIKEDLNLSRESQKEDLFKEEKVEKVEIVEAPKILDEPLDERVKAPEILDREEGKATPKLEVHKEIIRPEKDLKENSSQGQKVKEEKTYKEDSSYDKRENYNGETSLSPVKIIALVFMIVTGIASIATVLAFFGFFFSFIGGLL
ncbi:zinc ribbon domain-containing protein [Peptoniphilus vaginalis]|uniref:zinc ribbon domain-containing protein n=1 Tax=Peptoniphilus vaginalis TaxID=1756987 RepID=UPI0023F966A5|nr:zinc ribbon domain-containing protein [Peptoniphilus vaginalis]